MPYYVGDIVSDIDSSFFSRTPDDARKAGIDLLENHEVLSVDFQKKKLRARDLVGEEEKVFYYDKLVIATGAKPLIPKLEGVDAKNVYTMTKPYEAKRLKEDLASYKSIAVVGGGFIGVEIAEQLSNYQGLDVTLYHSRDQLLNKIYDSEAGEALGQEMKRLGVNLVFRERLMEIVSQGERVREIITSNRRDRVDALVLGLGFLPNTQIFTDEALEKTKNGAIVIDEYGRTSVEDVWSVGDCATVHHKFLGNVHIPLGTSANKIGRQIGINLFKDKEEDMVGRFQSLGSSFIKVGELEFGSTGLNEEQAKALGLDFEVASIKTRNKPGYMPDSYPLNMKIIYERGSKKILGARVFGKRDANMRLHTLSLAIKVGLTTQELAYVDFAYSPPFNGAWEALNILGSAAK